MREYKIGITIRKGILYTVAFIIPMLVDRFIISYPEYAQITLGGALIGLTNYLKFHYGYKY